MEGFGADIGKEFAKEVLSDRYDGPKSYGAKAEFIVNNLEYMLAVYETLLEYSEDWEERVDEIHQDLRFHQDSINELKEIESQARQSGGMSNNQKLKLREMITSHQLEMKVLEKELEIPPPVMYNEEPLPLDPAVQFVIKNLSLMGQIHNAVGSYFDVRAKMIHGMFKLVFSPIERILKYWASKSGDPDKPEEVERISEYIRKQAKRYARLL
jgi:hypothetical protein